MSVISWKWELTAERFIQAYIIQLIVEKVAESNYLILCRILKVGGEVSGELYPS